MQAGSTHAPCEGCDEANGQGPLAGRQGEREMRA